MSKNSIFAEIPKYEIKKTVYGDFLGFSITFNMLTVNRDYERYAKQFESGPVNNVFFDVIDDHKLLISLQHHQTFSEETDRKFRQAIGVASRHNLQSIEVDDIFKTYKQFLEDKNFAPPEKKSANLFSFGMSAKGDCAF